MRLISPGCRGDEERCYWKECDPGREVAGPRRGSAWEKRRDLGTGGCPHGEEVVSTVRNG